MWSPLAYQWKTHCLFPYIYRQIPWSWSRLLSPSKKQFSIMSDYNPNGDTKTSLQHGEHTMNALSTVPTSVTLSAEQFEKLYLTPMTRQQPKLARQVGNPTPLWDWLYHLSLCDFFLTVDWNFRALGGFVITTTPLSCCLMAWRGASGNGIAFM